jgi:hypothetical protein
MSGWLVVITAISAPHTPGASTGGTPRQVLQVGIAAVSTWLRNALAPQGAEEGQRTGSP